MSSAVTNVKAVAVRPDRHLEVPERLATEEPMEIRAAGPGQLPSPVAVTMRTPGHDFELAAGFLTTEGLVAPHEISAVSYCDAVRSDDRFNVVTVTLVREWKPAAARRDFVATSSCGICGKASIDQVEISCPTVAYRARLAASLVGELPQRLRTGQRIFDATGGLHAAGLFHVGGELLCLREDVGRHNAVDKVIGASVLSGSDRHREAVLVLSGRVSFEIVQKAAVSGIGLIAAVSAPSSLAVEAAKRLGVTVAGFVRNGTYNLYSHPERVDFDC